MFRISQGIDPGLKKKHSNRLGCFKKKTICVSLHKSFMTKGLFEFFEVLVSVDVNTTINCRPPVINGENNIGLNLECLLAEPTN